MRMPSFLRLWTESMHVYGNKNIQNHIYALHFFFNFRPSPFQFSYFTAHELSYWVKWVFKKYMTELDLLLHMSPPWTATSSQKRVGFVLTRDKQPGPNPPLANGFSIPGTLLGPKQVCPGPSHRPLAMLLCLTMSTSLLESGFRCLTIYTWAHMECN